MGTAPGRCPACNRFIGPLDDCPYCDCPAERRTAMRTLRALAVLLAFGGLALLALAVRGREPPLLRASEIRPSMNFALVRIEGAVTASARTGLTRHGNPWYGVTLDDGTGRIRVSAFGETARALSEQALTSGMVVRAEGSLSLKAGHPPSLEIRTPGALRRMEEAP